MQPLQITIYSSYVLCARSPGCWRIGSGPNASRICWSTWRSGQIHLICIQQKPRMIGPAASRHSNISERKTEMNPEAAVSLWRPFIHFRPAAFTMEITWGNTGRFIKAKNTTAADEAKIKNKTIKWGVDTDRGRTWSAFINFKCLLLWFKSSAWCDIRESQKRKFGRAECMWRQKGKEEDGWVGIILTASACCLTMSVSTQLSWLSDRKWLRDRSSQSSLGFSALWHFIIQTGHLLLFNHIVLYTCLDPFKGKLLYFSWSVILLLLCATI